MKKKIITLLFAIVASTGICFASYTSVGGIWYNFNNANYTAEVTYKGSSPNQYKGYSRSIVIPSSVSYSGTTYSVTSIGYDAFSGCSGMTSIEIPNSVTNIGSYALYGCSGLTSVTIPNSVTSIGNEAFSYCSDLTSIAIPNSVTSIGNDAFLACLGLTSVTMGNGVSSIAYGAFSGCENLKEIRVPKGQKERFAQMEGLKDYVDIIVECEHIV